MAEQFHEQGAIPPPEPMPHFAWIAVFLSLSATTASLFVLRFVAGH